MFVLRYLLASMLVIVTVVAWGTGQHYSAWHIAGLVAAAALAMQVAVVLLVAIMALRPPHDRKQRVARRPEHMAIASE